MKDQETKLMLVTMDLQDARKRIDKLKLKLQNQQSQSQNCSNHTNSSGAKDQAHSLSVSNETAKQDSPEPQANLQISHKPLVMKKRKLNQITVENGTE